MLLLLAACAVGPDYHRPALPASQGYLESPLPAQATSDPGNPGAAQRLEPGGSVNPEWWHSLGNPQLDALIERALRDSPDLAAARAALAQAQEQVRAQRAQFLPQASASYEAQRTKLSGNTASASAPGRQGNGDLILPLRPAEPVTYDFHTAQLTVGFVPDVFGGNRRAVESLLAQAQAAGFELAAARVTLASNIAGAAITEASLRAQIAAAAETVTAMQRALTILEGELRLGQVARIDVAAQQSALAQAEALLPPLEKELAQSRDLLHALVGVAPDQALPQRFELKDFTLPAVLPLSLPAHLVDQRPDVRAAESQVHAASAAIGVQLAARLPQFSIDGSYGGNADRFGQIFSGAGTFWSVLGSASMTVFDAGALRHRQRAAERAFDQAAAQYRATVLTAFRDVADTLQAIDADARGLSAAAGAERAARVTRDLTQRQLEAGYVSTVILLNAEQALQQAEINLIQAQAARLADTVALYQALGGGSTTAQNHAGGQDEHSNDEHR